MYSELIELFLREHKIAYIISDAELNVLEKGGEVSLFYLSADGSHHLYDLVPELSGCEEILQDVLTNTLPRFQLEHLNRTFQEEEVNYLNLTVLRYLPEASANPLLFITLTDISELARTQQILTQQRNELSLLKKSLTDTNHRLEFILQRYVPKEVGKALMENRIIPELGGEVRKVTALFADLRNYTSISESLTPTETIEMLHVCLDIAGTAIVEAGGVLVNYMGDAVMAIFNAPDDQIDHAKRAVQAGLDMQSRAIEYHRDNNASIEMPPLHFGVGINTGFALVGNIGAQGHYQYTAVGDTVNVASRICSHARPSEVLIGANTHAYLKDQIIAHPFPPIKFKGKSAEVTVYQVLSLKNK